MPTESNTSAPPPPITPQVGIIKCSICGSASTSMPSRGGVGEGVVILGEEIERICGSCVRSEERNGLGLDNTVGVMERIGIGIDDGEPQRMDVQATTIPQDPLDVAIPFPLPTYAQPLAQTQNNPLQSQSLPTHTPRPWTTTNPSTDSQPRTQSIIQGNEKSTTTHDEQDDISPNPLLDVTKMRIPSIGRGALYPGSTFRGTQTSGRSSYEVQVNFLVRHPPPTPIP
jgi:hypothetical protein